MTRALEDIDPALAAITAFSRVAPGTTQAIESMRQRAIFTDGVLDAKLKALAAVLWAVSARCEPCVKYYARKARERGATREELGEMMGVASVMGGCVGETWAVKAYHEFMSDATDGDDAPECCES